MRAVILAGGRGTRLLPYTTVLPKPLMPVGELPILELLIRKLRNFGFTRITMSVGYLGSLIMAYFGDGSPWGVSIEYSGEREPLGTAGPLSLIPDLDETFIVANGDLLTDVDLTKMVRFHRHNKALVTVGLHRRILQIDFGVIEKDGGNSIRGYIEKPKHEFLVSMGIYVFEPEALRYIPKSSPFDLPNLVNALLTEGERVVGYEHEGYWLDIGRLEDFQAAQSLSELTMKQLLSPPLNDVLPQQSLTRVPEQQE